MLALGGSSRRARLGEQRLEAWALHRPRHAGGAEALNDPVHSTKVVVPIMAVTEAESAWRARPNDATVRSVLAASSYQLGMALADHDRHAEAPRGSGSRGPCWRPRSASIPSTPNRPGS
jgi:hypothetical protein